MPYIPDAKTAILVSSAKLPNGGDSNLYEITANAIYEACRRGWRRASVHVGRDHLGILSEIRQMLDDAGYLTTITAGGDYATASEMMADERRYEYVKMEISW